MTQVTIVLTDEEADGTVNVQITFDPPAQPDAPMTGAEALAMDAMEALKLAASNGHR